MKINEFLKNTNIKTDIDRFIYYSDKWNFVENKEYLSGIIKYVDVDKFIQMGKEISENLNRLGISPDDYDITILDKFIDNL